MSTSDEDSARRASSDRGRGRPAGSRREVSDAVAEAARWRLLGLLLERPRPGWSEEVASLAREVSDRELLKIAASAGEASEGAYLRLLGPGGAASPREVAHRGLEDPGWVLSEIARCYAAFSFGPRAEDPPDHVAVEAGFVGFLHLKEALARAAGDVEAAATTAAAREAFVARHLAAVAAPLARRLGALGDSYLARGAARLAALVPPPREAAPRAVGDVEAAPHEAATGAAGGAPGACAAFPGASRDR